MPAVALAFRVKLLAPSVTSPPKVTEPFPAETMTVFPSVMSLFRTMLPAVEPTPPLRVMPAGPVIVTAPAPMIPPPMPASPMVTVLPAPAVIETGPPLRLMVPVALAAPVAAMVSPPIPSLAMVLPAASVKSLCEVKVRLLPLFQEMLLFTAMSPACAPAAAVWISRLPIVLRKVTMSSGWMAAPDSGEEPMAPMAAPVEMVMSVGSMSSVPG